MTPRIPYERPQDDLPLVLAPRHRVLCLDKASEEVGVRRASWFLAILGVLITSALVTAGPLEFYKTDRNVALFYNTEARAYVGLRVVFSMPVEPIRIFGIGTALTWDATGPAELTITGALDPLDVCEIDWALHGPSILEAAWILDDGTESTIDVHEPFAKIDVDLPPEIARFCSSAQQLPFVPIDVGFSGTWSSDPDGGAIVCYEWTWSDGVTASGEHVTRQFRVPGWYSVSLTVWDKEGKAGSTIQTVYVPRFRCPTTGN